jgi:hypothetical protein
MAKGGDWAAEFIQQKLNKLLRRAGKFPFFFHLFRKHQKNNLPNQPCFGLK